jgi:hypothetical protein
VPSNSQPRFGGSNGGDYGEIVCQARVELRDGSWVGPTKLEPYATPTPTGGVWREAPGGRSRLRLIVVTAARSPVRAESSCDYPLASEKSISGWRGDLKDFGVKLLEPRQGGGQPGEHLRYSLKSLFITLASLFVMPPLGSYHLTTLPTASCSMR